MSTDASTGTFALRSRPPFIGFSEAFAAEMREWVAANQRVYDLATYAFWTLAILFAAYDVGASLILADLGASEQNPLFRAAIVAAGGYWVLAPIKIVELTLAALLWRALPTGAEIGVPIGMTTGTLLPVVVNTLLLVRLL